MFPCGADTKKQSRVCVRTNYQAKDPAKLLNDLTADVVTTYLDDHPETLQQYVLKNVSAEEIDCWLSSKKSSQNDAPGQESIERPWYVEGPSSPHKIKELMSALQNVDNIWPSLHHFFTGLAQQLRAVSLLYRSCNQNSDLVLYRPDQETSTRLPVCHGATAVSYAAQNKKSILVTDIIRDERFSNGIGHGTWDVKSVIACPIILLDGDVLGVIQFMRACDKPVFKQSELLLIQMIISWICLGLHSSNQCESVEKQQSINTFVAYLSENIYDTISMHDLIRNVIICSKSVVGADKCTVYRVDPNTDEIYTNIVDEGIRDGQPVIVETPKPIRFHISSGIAGYVARSGRTVNVACAERSEHYSRAMDESAGPVLCVPISSKGKNVVGVIQVNKKANGKIFTKTDESFFKLFAVQVGLGMHIAKTAKDILFTAAELNVLEEQLLYTTRCTDRKMNHLLDNHAQLVENPPVGIDNFEFDCRPHMHQLIPLIVYMAGDLFGPNCFPLGMLYKLVVIVSRNYRDVPYHNWEHGWNVTHSMYCILKRTPSLFSAKERQGMFLAALCHDIDHRGLNNEYYTYPMVKEPFSLLYPSITMEQHHYNMAALFLQHPDTNILSRYEQDDLDYILDVIKICILATALETHQEREQILIHSLKSGSLNMKNTVIRHCIYGIVINCCDLCGSAKLWPHQRHIVDQLMDEFYMQGDIEKKMGVTPPALRDRTQYHKLPQQQIGFLEFVVLPMLRLLCDIMPIARPMLEVARDNYVQWKREFEGKSTGMWNVDNSYTDDEERPNNSHTD